MPEESLATMKVVLIGDSGVGKSSLCYGSPQTRSTKTSAPPSDRPKLSESTRRWVRTTAAVGHGRPRTVPCPHFLLPGAAVILVYDVNAPHSLSTSSDGWMRWKSVTEVVDSSGDDAHWQ